MGCAAIDGCLPTDLNIFGTKENWCICAVDDKRVHSNFLRLTYRYLFRYLFFKQMKTKLLSANKAMHAIEFIGAIL